MAGSNERAPAGPNDYHVTKEGSLQPGLGDDQPRVRLMNEARDNGMARLEGLRAEVAAANEELTEREQVIAGLEAEAKAREELVAQREAAIAQREADLAKRESATGKK